MKKQGLYIHPIILTLIYCLIEVVGQESAGFFIKYLVVGFFHGTIFGFLGVGGLLAIFISLLLPVGINKLPWYLIGVTAMIMSLCVFFLADRERYNYPTFTHVFPLVILLLFGGMAILFIINILSLLLKGERK